MSRFLSILALCCLYYFSPEAYSQSIKYVNSLDVETTVTNVAIYPVIDNTKGIYSAPAQIALQDSLKADSQWSSGVIDSKTKIVTPEELEDDALTVKKILNSNGINGLITLRISKTSVGFNFKMNLFSGPQGKLLLTETLEDYQGFSVDDISEQVRNLYKKIKQRLPYDGLITSRKGQLVTVNLGTADAVNVGDNLTIFQIVKIERHPKFNFIVRTEKEILGRLVVSKADTNLSFASIVMERDPQVIDVGMKVSRVGFVKYNEVGLDKEGNMKPELNDRLDGDLSFGNQPKEWLPATKPTFGSASLLLNIGSYSINDTVVDSQVPPLSTQGNLVPSMHLDSQIWLTKNWFVGFDLRQFIFSASNPRSESAPKKLNVQTTNTSVSAGYYFLMTDDFFGPKFHLGGGYSQFKAAVDGSEPLALTSLDFSGFTLKFGGSFVTDPIEFPLTLEAGMIYYFWNPSVAESPVTSGSSKSANAASFYVNGKYPLTLRMDFKAELVYDSYGASFSGTGSRPTPSSGVTHTATSLGAGIQFYF